MTTMYLIGGSIGGSGGDRLPQQLDAGRPYPSLRMCYVCLILHFRSPQLISWHSNPRPGPSTVLYDFEWPYLGNGSPILFAFGSWIKV